MPLYINRPKGEGNSGGGGSSANTFKNFSELSVVKGNTGDQAIVLEDETKLPVGETHVYEYDGTNWNHKGKINVQSISEYDRSITEIESSVNSQVNEISSFADRISSLESKPISTTDEKIKLNADDTSNGYLQEKIDDTTVKIVDGKLKSTSLDGLIATITELNYLSGVTSNLQAQLNAITNIGNFTGSVQTYADIDTLFPTPDEKDMVIVIADENNADDTVIYVYGKTGWVYSGKFTATVRDFTANPLNLDTETTSILPKAKYEKPGALDIPIIDATGKFNANNVEDALIELFTYADNIKTGVANVIGSPLTRGDTTDEMINKISTIKANLIDAIKMRGLAAYPANTLNELVNKVRNIPNVSINGTVKRYTKINIVAPQTYNVVLKEPLQIEDIVTTVLEYTGADSGIVQYNSDYNNTDAKNFTFNSNSVEFDGYMKIKDTWKFAMIDKEQETYYESDLIDFSSFVDFKGDLEVDITSISMNAINSNSQVVKANGDISLLGVDTLDNVNFVTFTEGNGISKMAMSFDSGLTWKAYNGSSWIDIDINNKNNFKTNGMTKSVVNSLTNIETKVIRGDSNTVRFAYYLERPLYDDIVYNDKIQLVVTMKGYNIIASNSSYSYNYDAMTKTLSYTFTKNGTYTINYVDGV